MASSTRFESMAATTSSSFSCEVTTIQQGATILRAFSRFLPTLPNSSTVARRSSILSPLRATCWPTSSMMKTRALPGRRRPASSKVRSTTLLTVIVGSRFAGSATTNPPRGRSSGRGGAGWRWHGRPAEHPCGRSSSPACGASCRVSMNSVEPALRLPVRSPVRRCPSPRRSPSSRRRTTYINSAIRSVTLRVSCLLGDLEENDLGRESWR